MAGAARVVGSDDLHLALADADAVVLALALTGETRGIIGAAELKGMKSHAWLVNVARGSHIVTADLVDALSHGTIAGAALDVTEPEPLPDGHPLWSMPNCLITPHVGAGNLTAAVRLLAARVTDNVRRFGTGAPLLGLVQPPFAY
jgi:D-3-phosphoglycerate dehydrogenase